MLPGHTTAAPESASQPSHSSQKPANPSVQHEGSLRLCSSSSRPNAQLRLQVADIMQAVCLLPKATCSSACRRYLLSKKLKQALQRQAAAGSHKAQEARLLLRCEALTRMSAPALVCISWQFVKSLGQEQHTRSRLPQTLYADNP